VRGCVHRTAPVALPHVGKEKPRATGNPLPYDAVTSKGTMDVKMSRRTIAAAVLALGLVALSYVVQCEVPDERDAGREGLRGDVEANATPLGDVLQALEAQFHVAITTAPEVKLTIPITVELRDVTLEEALLSIAERCGYVVIRRDREYLVRPRKPGEIAGEVFEGEPTPLTVEECAQILQQPPDRDLKTARQRFAAIERLAQIGSANAVDMLAGLLRGDPGPTPDVSHTYRQLAVCALGQIGSEEAVAAITAFEEWAAARYADPPPWRIAPPDMPVEQARWYDAQALAIGADGAGAEWAIFRWRKFKEDDLWMARSLGNGQWDQPILVDIGEGTGPWRQGQFALGFDGGRFSFSTSTRFSPEDFTRDTDEDGLPDIVEFRMRTAHNKPDTDGDGVPDGIDSNPLTTRHHYRYDEAKIRQAVFTAMYATSSARRAICISGQGDWRTEEYYGYLGPVLRSSEPMPGFDNITDLSVELTTPTTATVAVGLELMGYSADLVKVHGKWVVTEFQMTWIS